MPPADEVSADARWVSIDVAVELFGLSRRRVLEMARHEGWPSAKTPGMNHRQYSFQAIVRTYHQRKAPQP